MIAETRTTAQPLTLADLVANGYLHGYQAGPPPAASAECIEIDESACRDSSCEHCGQRGLRYRPYHRRGSYVAFAVCPSCLAAVEF